MDITGSLPSPPAAAGAPAPHAAPGSPAAAERLPAAIGGSTLRLAAIAGDPFAAYEIGVRFSEGRGVTHIIASLKTISEDGGFEIKNLMRGSDNLPVPKLRTIIDRDLFHRAPGRIPSGDLLEFG